MDIGNLRINLPKHSGPAGCFTLLVIFVGWLICVGVSILASAILVDALWHLGRWLLGW
jgi:hypothetical protein